MTQSARLCIAGVVRAAVIYFALVFAVGLLLGPVRVIWAVPRVGEAVAVALEAPFLVLAMWFAARAAPTWARLSSGGFSHLAVGVLALALQQGADVAVGFGLRGMTLSEQRAEFATPAGVIYATTLVAFALMPLIRMRRRR